MVVFQKSHARRVGIFPRRVLVQGMLHTLCLAEIWTRAVVQFKSFL